MLVFKFFSDTDSAEYRVKNEKEVRITVWGNLYNLGGKRENKLLHMTVSRNFQGRRIIAFILVI